MAAQRLMVAFQIHRRLAPAAVEMQDCVVIYLKAKVQARHNAPDLRLHKDARSGGGRHEGRTEGRQGFLPRPVVDERIW
jgi:hypothetical protein